jgi:hypothetical protein
MKPNTLEYLLGNYYPQTRRHPARQWGQRNMIEFLKWALDDLWRYVGLCIIAGLVGCLEAIRGKK